MLSAAGTFFSLLSAAAAGVLDRRLISLVQVLSLPRLTKG